MRNYIVVALLTGTRTEELRALRWDHVHLEQSPDGVPAYLEVWRSVRGTGDTKTRSSRRTLALPARGGAALLDQAEVLDRDRVTAGEQWHDEGYVFPAVSGRLMDKDTARRSVREALDLVDGVDSGEWTPRELRHSFVSLLSDAGLSLDDISRLVGHSETSVTELVYRHQIRPVLQTGAVAMEALFGPENRNR